MNAPLSDGNESVVDIFILSANSLLSSQLEKQLREEGYYVSLFSDGTHLLETLRNGKPNLLVCDTTVPDADAFEVCRQMKADEYLWNIPVLIITAASDLGDLLRVLDCNADNFIAYPFDPSYLLSLIDGTLTIPVERPTSDQIKTQFKIKHDDEVFVITADRRKLLELLLSSFEIAISKSSDLVRAQENIQYLGTTTRKLEENIHENTRVIGILNETLKSKEQKITELTGSLSDREQVVREKIATIDQVSRDLSEEKTAHEEARSEIQQILKEKDESTAAHQAAIGEMQLQVSDLSSELARIKTALERANGDLAGESSRRQETERELGTTTAQKEQAETALASLAIEHEQLKIDFDAEKNLAQQAIQELDAVLLAKTRSEQDLTGIINDMKTAAEEQAAARIRLKEEQQTELTRLKEEQQTELTRLKEERETEFARLKEERETELAGLKKEQETELTRLKEEREAEFARLKEERETELAGLKKEQEIELTRLKEEREAEFAHLKEELASEHTRLHLAEENLNSVTAAKEKSETWLQETIDAGQKDLVSLQIQLDAARSLLEEKEQTINTLTGESARVSSARESAEQELASVSRVLAETNAALGGKKEEILELEARLNTARSQVEEKQQAITTMGAEIATLRSSKTSTEQELSSVSRLLAEKNTALEAETQNIASHKENLARAYQEKRKADARAESLSFSLKELQDQLEQEKSRYRLNEERMSALILQRDRELSELRQVHEEVRTAVSSHETSLMQMTQDLDAAVSARTELEGNLRAAEEKIHRISQDLESESGSRAEEKQKLATLADQLEQVKSGLEQETLRRQESEDQLREALSQQQRLEQDLERFESETKTLHADLAAGRRKEEAAKKQIRSLEEQVSALSRVKLKAEQTAADLKAEIDQAGITLANESETRITDNEPALADAGKKQQPGPAPFSGVKKEAEIIKKRSLIVKGTTFPVEIHPLPRSMVAIDTVKVPEPEKSQIAGVEDLFEDAEDDGNPPAGEPVVSIIQEPASEPVRDVLPDTIPDRIEDRERFFEDDGSPTPDSGNPPDEEVMDDEMDDEDPLSYDGNASTVSGQNMVLNRTQWLDLLKWSYHCDALSPDERMQIIRLGRLIQKGRKLTRRQDEQVLELVARAQRLGYRIP
jgi:DNA-binding response OmpR family regulator